MKLSELVNFYNQLCALTSVPSKQATDIEVQKITHMAPELESLRLKLLESFDEFENEFGHIKDKIQKQIRQEERVYLQNSYKTYEERRPVSYDYFDMTFPDPRPNYLRKHYETIESDRKYHLDTILNNRLDISESAQNQIISRISRYSNWQAPAMIIRPGIESWIHTMVSCDPLYLLDESHDLLKPIMSQFNDVYRNRLRPYVIREDQEKDILWQIPDNQFGLILVYNYFNHKPFEIIRQYLSEIYERLKPGGMLLMTYNDCDRWPGVVAVENNRALYTPGVLLQTFAESLGFEIIYNWNENGTWTWLELRKPGERQSLRAGQALAKILPKTLA
jgi:SAM-dependent methyltransferase